jgi:hypothetical protein
MNIQYALSGLTIGIMFLLSSCQRNITAATVPFTLGHNRRIASAENWDRIQLLAFSWQLPRLPPKPAVM